MGIRVEASSGPPWTAEAAPLVEALLRALDDGDARAVETLCAAHPRERDLFTRVEVLHRRLVAAAQGIAPVDATPAPGRSSRPAHLLGLGHLEIPGHELQRELGHGGMGVVFEALELETRRTVALKVIPVRDGHATRERYRREIAALARLKSPHVVTLHTSGALDGAFYYTMELLEGETFDRTIERWRLRRDPDRFQQAAGIVAQAAAGAAVIHAAGIIHRDLKPSNLFIAPDGTVKLIDFGLVRVLGDETVTRTGALVGSAAYMSSEQLLGGKRRVDERSDVYSLGATLYEACALRLPFDPHEGQVAGRLSEQGWTPLVTIAPDIPADLAAIVEKACEFRPEDRYPDASALAADLRAFQAGAPVMARPLGRWGRMARRARRHRGLLAAAGVGLAILVGIMVGAGFWLESSRREAAVARAIALASRAFEKHCSIRGRLPAVRERAERATAEVSEDDVFASRREALDAGSELEELEASAIRAFDEALLAAQRGFEESPSHPALRELVGKHAWDRLLEVEREGSEQEAERLRGILRNYAPGLTSRLEARARLEIRSEPPGAIVRLFRHQPSGPFFLAIPYVPGKGALLEVDELPGPRMEVVREPAASLRELGLERGDRIVSINGQPIDLSGNRSLRRLHDVGSSRVEIEREGRALTIHLPPEPVGTEYLFMLFNECVDSEAFPLALLPGAVLGPTPVESFELPAGSYLVVLEMDGRRVRAPVLLGRDEVRSMRVDLHRGKSPGAEWVLIPAGPALLSGDPLAHHPEPRRTVELDDYFILRREVSTAEYFRFLNDPEILAEIAAAEAAGDESPLLPVDQKGGARPVYTRNRLPDGRRELYPSGVETMQRYVQRAACERYIAWLNERERRAGGPFSYALPSSDELEKAARGADGRQFPWGNRFELSLLASSRSSGMASFRSLPFATDTSPYGVCDLAGSVREWTRDTEPPPFTSPSFFELREARVKGGSFITALASDFRLGGHTREKVRDSLQDIGFRVVARLRYPGEHACNGPTDRVPALTDLGLRFNPDAYAVPRWFADVDGDRRFDFCRLKGAEPPLGDGLAIDCLLDDGASGFGKEISIGGVALGGPADRWFADVDGDARDDLVRLVPTGGAHLLMTLRSVEGPFDDEIISSPLDAGLAGNRWLADVDGDRRADFCRLVELEHPASDRFQLRCLLSCGDAWGGEITSEPLEPGLEKDRWMTDVNGDSRADFCRLVSLPPSGPVGVGLRCTPAAERSFGADLEQVEVTPGSKRAHWVVDADGDACADFVRFVDEGGECRVRYSAGCGQGFQGEIQPLQAVSQQFRDRRASYWTWSWSSSKLRVHYIFLEATRFSTSRSLVHFSPTVFVRGEIIGRIRGWTGSE